jgi:D-xylose transport system substrate-binding protein
MHARIGLVIISLILSVAIGAAIARGGGDGRTPGAGVKRAPIVGLSFATLKEERWQRDLEIFTKACAEQGVEVRALSADSDNYIQASQAAALVSQGVDALVIMPNDSAALAAAVDQAAAAGVPVMAYDRLITGTANLALYATFDNAAVGRAQARFLAERFGERRWRLLRILGAPTDNNARLFKAGQDEVLEPLIRAGRVEIVFEDWAVDWRPENAKKIAAAAITRLGADGFDAVLASNDGTAAGAIEALREAGLVGRVPVTGQDAELAAVQRIALGEQAMTIYKPLPVLARQAAGLAVRLARRQPVVAAASTANGASEVPAVFSPVHAVTAENIQDTVVKDGFHTYEAVYGSLPAERQPPRR